MFGTLPPRAAGLPLLYHAQLQGLALVQPENDDDGYGENDHDDCKGPERPAEVNLIIEQLRNNWTSEDTGNNGCLIDAEHNHTVLQGCHICQHDRDDITNTDVSYPVDRLCRRVHLHRSTGCFEDHAEDYEEDHDGEALNTAPDVDDLGDRELTDTAHNVGDNACGSQQTVLGEG